MRSLTRGDILSLVTADYPYILVQAARRYVGTGLRTDMSRAAPTREEIDPECFPVDEAALVERIKTGESFFTVTYSGWSPQTMDLVNRCLRVELP